MSLSRSSLCASLCALILVLTALVSPANAATTTATGSCTAGGVVWRVEYSVSDSTFGPLVRVTGLRRADTDASAQVWELRWDNTPAEYPPAAGQPPLPFHSVRGTLSGSPKVGDVPVAIYLSPRLVVPDGSCQVYLAPFGNGHGQAHWPRVAVLGDSLVQQLNDSDYNAGHGIQGYVEGNLNTAGILAEVEGQGARRWTDGGGTGLVQADSYLMDEFRGLLSHEVNGFVTALGANDAIHIAFGSTPQERTARREEVTGKLVAVLGEMRGRTGCLVAITAPEHANQYSAHYAEAATAINDVVRWVAAADGGDSLTLVDFAAQAKTHRNTDPAPWFDTDNLHLNAAGKLVYTATITQAAERCKSAATPSVVKVYGKPGSFGTLGETGSAPSGQPLGTVPVTGWDIPPGQSAFFSAVAADGTLFTGGLDHNTVYFFPTADDTAIMAYDPAKRAYENIRVPSTTGRTHARHPDGAPGGSSIADLQPLSGGNAMAFTVPSPYTANHDGAGEWPAFGILTKVNGRWQVAEGNSWTQRQLHESHPTLGPLACPADGGKYFCRALNEMALFPASKDVVIAQYTSMAGQNSGAIVVLRVTGPDAQGRYSTQIRGHYQIPRFLNPQTDATDDYAELSVLAVEPDPTGTVGDERFTAIFDAWNVHNAAVEFSYDATTGAIKPVSAPFIAGDADQWGKTYGSGAHTYDRQGNLWIKRNVGFGNGPLSVYARTPGQLNIGGTACAADPAKTWDQYTSTIAGKKVWGLSCRPDYSLLQARDLGGITGVAHNPGNGDVVVLGMDGTLSAIRPSGSGAGMSFRISAPMDVGRSALPVGSNPAVPSVKAVSDTRLGGFDAAGRFWYWLGQRVGPSCPIDLTIPPKPCMADNRYARLDQWLVSIETGRLLDPVPVQLPATAGWQTRIEAEYTATTTTSGSPVVDSAAYLHRCMSGWATSMCADSAPDNSYRSEGLVLSDDTGVRGHPGGPVEFKVVAPVAGSYQLAYRTRMRGTPSGQIQVQVGQTAYPPTTVAEGGWTVVNGPAVDLATGQNTIRLSAPAGQAGWYLNWFTLTRR